MLHHAASYLALTLPAAATHAAAGAGVAQVRLPGAAAAGDGVHPGPPSRHGHLPAAGGQQLRRLCVLQMTRLHWSAGQWCQGAWITHGRMVAAGGTLAWEEGPCTLCRRCFAQPNRRRALAGGPWHWLGQQDCGVCPAGATQLRCFAVLAAVLDVHCSGLHGGCVVVGRTA